MQSENPSQSPVLDEVLKAQQELKTPEYSQEEIDYLSGLQIKLERARDAREQKHDEFDGMSYAEYWESNEKGADYCKIKRLVIAI
jgi:hypothetical protein